MNLTIILTGILAIFAGLFFYAYNIINKTIGIKGLLMYYNAFKNRKKGIILLRVYSKLGSINYKIGKLKGSELVTSDLKQDGKNASFIADSNKIYFNEMNLRSLDVFENDIEPRSWKNSYDMPINPYAFENINVNSIKSETASSWIEDFLKQYGKLIGLFILILIGILVFMLIHQNDAILTLSQQLAGTKSLVVN